MALSDSLPQINLGVQGGTQGSSNSGAQRVNPEFRVGSNFRIIPEQYFSGMENVAEFLENIDNNLTYYEIPTQLACAYLKGHLTRRALDWFEVLGYRVVEDNATNYAHLKQALTEQFPVVRNRSELQTRFYASSQKHNQKPSDFVYGLLKIHIQIRQENWRETRVNNRYSDNSRPQRESNRFEGQGVGDNQRFDSRRRSDQSDHRFNNQGGRQDDQPGLTRVLYHEIDTGDQGPVVSRFYRYYRVKQGIIDYHIEKMLQEDICEQLYRLKKKGARFNWSTEAHDAFDKIKRALTEAPVLQLPNFTEQFNLFTDASGVGIGAVLNQNHRPIAFASISLNKAERNYIVTEPECLAVTWTLNKFRTYFGSLPVKVITDHAALTKLTNGKNLSSRMIRWALKLSEFNIEWEHRRGVQDVVVDVLSRNPIGNMDGSQISCAALRALALKKLQRTIHSRTTRRS
ncbi:retrovirus-related Pol polyprotein from transposon 17.6 [Trichonephila clavipes]|nr:retrovirus-related Pol polyprotein from transposon 17.6 [Trichonephila clavipes]